MTCSVAITVCRCYKSKKSRIMSSCGCCYSHMITQRHKARSHWPLPQPQLAPPGPHMTQGSTAAAVLRDVAPWQCDNFEQKHQSHVKWSKLLSSTHWRIIITQSAASHRDNTHFLSVPDDVAAALCPLPHLRPVQRSSLGSPPLIVKAHGDGMHSHWIPRCCRSTLWRL